jgi:phosphohistidine phosphatase SixA
MVALSEPIRITPGAPSMRAPRLLITILALLTLAGSLPAAAQTPSASPQASPGATPAPAGFVVVAYIEASEWAEPLPEVEPGVDLGGRTLLDALREGGFVIYFRHAATDTSSDQNVDLRYCSTQRNLSQLGKDQSVAIGEGFEALQIPVGEVRSSEYCRARDTAELAFGGMAEVTPEPMLTPFESASEGEASGKTAWLVEALSTAPADGTNTVLVAHQFNITEAAGLSLEEGEAVVILPVG